MKYSTSKNELQSALQKLSKAVPNRATLPILSCVLIDVSESGTLLRSTDLEITITTHIESSIEEQGTAAVPLQPLLDITSELPEGSRVEMGVDKNNVKIDMTLTTPNCPVAESLPNEVKNSVKEIKEVKDVDLKLVWEPPWDKTMMSDSAKLELNI